MNTSVDSTPAFVEATYKKMDANITTVRERLNRPLTYGEKILYGHLDNAAETELIAGTSYIKTRPDRIALQDATAQMAILQFMLAEKNEAAVPVLISNLPVPQIKRSMTSLLPPPNATVLAAGCREQESFTRWSSNNTPSPA